MDLFKSDRNKRIWDLKINHLGRSYDVVGVFNFDEVEKAPTYVSWKDLGLPEDSASSRLRFLEPGISRRLGEGNVD